jgi:4-hydroxybenzoate polyprenyltransferase
MKKIKNYLSFVKFAHSIFAMPFALVGFFMAINLNELTFDWWLLLYVVLAMVFARNAAMGFNRYIDRNIDKKNPRTAGREIPAGKINPRAALAFVVINAVLFMGVTWFINGLCFVLSPIALLVVLGYSLTKRFTALCHFILGLGLSLSPIGAYIAVTGSFNHWAPILVSLTVLLWTAGFDIIYALQDEEFDEEQKLHSVPQKLGRKKALYLAIGMHVLSVVSLVFSGILLPQNILYLIAVCIFAGFVFYQHTLVKVNDLSRVNLAFFTMNGIASLVFGTVAILSFYV